MPTLISDRRLYLTSDRAEVVEEGDLRAGWLLAGGPGAVIPADAVARYHLSHAEGKIVLPGKEPPAPPPAEPVTAAAAEAVAEPEEPPQPEPMAEETAAPEAPQEKAKPRGGRKPRGR